jgi:hypothetical protein
MPDVIITAIEDEDYYYERAKGTIHQKDDPDFK